METNELPEIPCPFCKQRAVDTTATLSRVRGFLVAYQISTRKLIGCAPCVRSELYKEAGTSALLGWFSITALFINPILITTNLVRGATLRPNPNAVMKRLKEIGYKPGGGPNMLQVGYALAAAMIAADGKIEPQEIDMAVKFGQNIFEGFDANQFQAVCKAHQQLPPSHELAGMLRNALSDAQKEAIVNYLFAIAQADGAISETEHNQLAMVATGLNFDLDAWTAKLTAQTQHN